MSGSPRASVTTAWAVLAICAFARIDASEPDWSNSLPGKSILSDPPAVEDINAKASYSGGWMDSAEGHNFDASISLPVTHAFGFQADGLYSRISGLDFYGGAGHLFWRDPELGLVGVAGGYLSRSGVDTFQVGAEAEYYLGQFSFGAFAGVGRIAYNRPVPFIETEPTRFVGSVRTDWYPFDDVRVGACYIGAFDNSLFKGDIEFQTPIAGLALTAEGAIGDHHYDHVLFGVRYYFGAEKTLRERHRRLDPRSLMPQILHSLGLYGAEYNCKAKAYFASLASVLGFDPGYLSSGVINYYGVSSQQALYPPISEYGANVIGIERRTWLPNIQSPPLPPIEMPALPGPGSFSGSASARLPGGAFTSLGAERVWSGSVEITRGYIPIIGPGVAITARPIEMIRGTVIADALVSHVLVTPALTIEMFRPSLAQPVRPGFDSTRQLPNARPARELRPPIRPGGGGS